MRRSPLFVCLLSALLSTACSAAHGPPPPVSGQHATPAATRPAAPVEALVTLQDVMLNEVDASADAIWEATGTITTREGTVDRRPRTEAEWEALRRHAVVLLEATNLLVIPDRKVTDKPFPSDGPGVLSSAEIQQRIDGNREEFNGFALGLRQVARAQLQAIDARDVDALLTLGDAMDTACEACHRANWYPNEVVPPLPANPPPPSSLQ